MIAAATRSLQSALHASSVVPHVRAAAERERRLALSSALARQKMLHQDEADGQGSGKGVGGLLHDEVTSSQFSHFVLLAQEMARQNEELTKAVQITNQEVKWKQQRMQMALLQQQQLRALESMPTIENINSHSHVSTFPPLNSALSELFAEDKSRGEAATGASTDGVTAATTAEGLRKTNQEVKQQQELLQTAVLQQQLQRALETIPKSENLNNHAHISTFPPSNSALSELFADDKSRGKAATGTSSDGVTAATTAEGLRDYSQE
eukprot:gene3437-13493_t